MTFAGYFQSGSHEMPASTLGGTPIDKPEYIHRYALTHIITDVPEGTTKLMVEKKMERKSFSAIKLEFCIESECPSDVQAQIKAPGSNVTEVSWSSL